MILEVKNMSYYYKSQRDKRSSLSFSTNCNLKQSIQTVEGFSLCWDRS